MVELKKFSDLGLRYAGLLRPGAAQGYERQVGLQAAGSRLLLREPALVNGIHKPKITSRSWKNSLFDWVLAG